MGNGNGTIGKLNPATGEITVYKMPDPNARDPHTPIWLKDGTTLFFTLQQSNMIGRMNTDDRRDQAGHRADGAGAALRHQGQLAGIAVGVLQRIERRG